MFSVIPLHRVTPPYTVTLLQSFTSIVLYSFTCFVERLQCNTFTVLQFNRYFVFLYTVNTPELV